VILSPIAPYFQEYNHGRLHRGFGSSAPGEGLLAMPNPDLFRCGYRLDLRGAPRWARVAKAGD